MSEPKPYTLEDFDAPTPDRFLRETPDNRRILATVEALEHWKEQHHQAIRRTESAERELRRLGFRPCDVAACNCGGWHRHRLTVIEESLSAQVEALKKDRDWWRDEHEKRRGECLAALMVEKAAQDRAETAEKALERAERERDDAKCDAEHWQIMAETRINEAEVREAMRLCSVGHKADRIMERIKKARGGK